MKIRILLSLVILSIALFSCGSTQKTTQKTKQHTGQKEFDIRTVAFYNLENLFDTINDPTKMDEKSPIMDMKEGNRAKAYWAKIDNMAKIVSIIGKEKAHTSPAIIGVVEIENKAVLEDLIANEHLKSKDYGIVHYESPDVRGIDVALLYQKRYFKPMDSESYELKLLDDDGEPYATRDQLLVTGLLDDEVVHIIVNHWPSRRGGEQKSRPSREKAAALNLQIMEDIKKEYPNPKVIIMGDLNDDPNNSSLRNILKAKGEKENLKDGEIFNPMDNMFQRGLSTLGYRDNINLFDQILLTSPLVTANKDYGTYKLFKANIFNPNYMTQKKGRYKGYPFRSWNGANFTGGYSDHYPVYIYLLKEK